MANSPDITALGAYAGKYEKKLFSKLFNSFDIANDIQVYPNVKGKIKLTKLTAGKGARPYSSIFEGKGTDLQYTNRDAEAIQAKRDLLVEPSKYRQTWMAESMKDGVNVMDIPFAQYVWEQVMIELAAEINDTTAYYGLGVAAFAAYAAGTAYAVGDKIIFSNPTSGIIDYWICNTITTAGQSPVTHAAKWTLANAEAICVGLGTLIAAEIVGGGLTAQVTGAITNTNAVAKVELMVRKMPVAYRKAGFGVFVSYDVFDKYQDDYRERYGKNFMVNADGFYYVDGSSRKIKLIPCTWMGTSQRIICSPKENLLMLTDKLSDMQNIRTIEQMYTLQAGISFGIGFQIRDLEAMQVNDQP